MSGSNDVVVGRMVHVTGSIGFGLQIPIATVTRMVARQLSSYVVRIPKANIYRFGDSDRTRPVLAGVDWTVREGESWAVVGSGVGEKTALLEVKRDTHHSSTIPRLRAIHRHYLETRAYPRLLLVDPCQPSRSSRVPLTRLCTLFHSHIGHVALEVLSTTTPLDMVPCAMRIALHYDKASSPRNPVSYGTLSSRSL